MASYLSCYTLLLVIFNIFVTSKLSTGSRNHVYFSTNEDSHFIGDRIPVTFHKDFNEKAGRIHFDEALFNSRIHLKFLPPFLDFKERHLGIPHHQMVTIINLSCNRSVVMSSISGSTLHFHSSFFRDKIIPPLGNTSFTVIFLGRGEGVTKSYLYIHTSEGSFKYQVKGESVYSPYRLRTLAGVKLPINATYTPEIYLHNPHPAALQVLEAYSSGNEFHLELPSGEPGGPSHIWQIPAFFTKPIVRLKFQAFYQKNYSAYVRLKIDRAEDQILMIPVDVEVSGNSGLYALDDMINFGIGGTLDPPKKLKLLLLNSAMKPIKVVSVSSSPASKTLNIYFKTAVVPPKSVSPTEVAEIALDWNAAFKCGQKSGKIIIKSNHLNQKLILKYYASVFEGGLEYDSSQIHFKSDETDVAPRLISLLNNFKFPVVITGVSLKQSAAPYFEIRNFSSATISPGEKKDLFYLEVNDNFYNSRLLIESGIHISTNVSGLVIPLFCYTGKLTMISSSQRINPAFSSLGSMVEGDQGVFYFALVNENPIPIHIKSLDLNITHAFAGIVSVQRGSITRAMQSLEVEYEIDLKQDINIPPRSFGILHLSVFGGDIGSLFGSVSVTTDFEKLEINFVLKIIEKTLLNDQQNGEELLIQNDSSEDSISDECHYSSSDLKAKSEYLPEKSYKFFLPSNNLPLKMDQLNYSDGDMNDSLCHSADSNSSKPYRMLNSFHISFFPRHSFISSFVFPDENFIKQSSQPFLFTSSEMRNVSPRRLFKSTPWPHGKTPRIVRLPNNEFIFTDSPLLPSPASQLVIEPCFSSTDPFHYSNNLSSNEEFKPSSQKGSSQQRIINRNQGGNSILLFEITEKNLRACENLLNRSKNKKNHKSSLSVRRSFFARNTGSLPLSVVGFLINDRPCEAYGFHVLNCEPFTLPANSSKKIDIIFTPDFTLSKVHHLLTVVTLDSMLNFTLSASLPPYLLSLCSSAIKRPSWEPLVYYSVVSFMLFLLICVLGAAFFESNRILRNTIITLSRDSNLQPVLDLRVIGSEQINQPEQNAGRSEATQCKIVWTSNSFNEEQAPKEPSKPATENIFALNCNNKCQIISNGVNCKKKSERTICKRFSDVSENYIEKTCWETSFNRSNSTQPLKTSICITTEPYIPLADLKTSDTPVKKTDLTNSKVDQTRFVEFHRRKTRKKSQPASNSDANKKKLIVPATNIFDGSDSSRSTSMSSCVDESEKDVESTFFQTVRHHLQSKVGRNKTLKLSLSSPATQRKKAAEKVAYNSADNEWENEEDDLAEKATVVRSNRRSSTSIKPAKKQGNMYGKSRPDQQQVKSKQNLLGEKSIKNSTRKEKTQATKKRNERMEKRAAAFRAVPLVVGYEGGSVIPSPPVWTASFSDVVAGTDPSYSSVVATKHVPNGATKNQLTNSGSNHDSGNSSSGSSGTNYSNGWKAEYQDALEQQEPLPEQAVNGGKPILNNIWSNWSSLVESLQNQSSSLQASANSLFTDTSSQNNRYETMWNDRNNGGMPQESQEAENGFQNVRNETSWPVITSLWEPIYTPSTSVVETPPPVWGSDVWGPPIPPASPPPVEEMIQTSLEYDPFRSLSNIWAQHSPNIWKPPTSE